MHRQLLTVLDMDYADYERYMFDTDPQLALAYRGRQSRVAVAANFPVPTAEAPDRTHVPTPWESASCALCQNELDCRAGDEYCSPEGCCVKGECLSDSDCVAQSARDPYYKIQNFDSFGSDINPLHPQDNAFILRTACDVNPDCVAYNSYGFFKHTVRPPQLWYPQPPIKGLPPWVLYIKKSATKGANPKVKLPQGVKTYCSVPYTTRPGESKFTPTLIEGTCKQCLACAQNADCPDSTVCTVQDDNKGLGCCVNNPCYVATPENGKWVDGRYTREPQCYAPNGEKYCCLSDPTNPRSAYASAEPCATKDQLMACSYICEDPSRKHDAVMCKANEICCNKSGTKPQCCAPGTDCGAAGQCTPVASGQGQTRCKGKPGYGFDADKYDVFCFPSETCCNDVETAPPVCCNQPALGCFKGGVAGRTSNGCNYNELT
jgi:hypothetical protein